MLTLQPEVPDCDMRIVCSPLIGELITVGRESNATIRIYVTFAGWETVSPRHARLT